MSVNNNSLNNVDYIQLQNEINSLLANKEYDKAIELARKYNLPQQVINQIEAIKLIRESMKLAQEYNIEEALSKLEKASQLYPTFNYSKFYAYIEFKKYEKLMNDYLQKQDYINALTDVSYMLLIAKQFPDTFSVQDVEKLKRKIELFVEANRYIQFADINILNNQFDKAYENINTALRLLNEAGEGDQPVLQNLLTALSYLKNIPPQPQAPESNSINDAYKYVVDLYNYFDTASKYFSIASQYYPDFSKFAQLYAKNRDVMGQLVSVMKLAVNAVQIVNQDPQQSLNYLNEAEQELNNIKTSGTILTPLYNSIKENITFLKKRFQDFYKVKTLVAEAQSYVSQGKYADAVNLLKQAQQISDANNLGINLRNYINGFSILANLKQQPGNFRIKNLGDLVNYLNALSNVLQNNINLLQKAQQYLNNINVQQYENDLNVINVLKTAVIGVQNALNSIPQSSDLNAILQTKNNVLNTIENAISVVKNLENNQDLSQFVQQIESVLDSIYNNMNIYYSAVQDAFDAESFISSANNYLSQKIVTNDPVQYYSALIKNYSNAIYDLDRAIKYAVRANQEFQQLSIKSPFDIDKLNSTKDELTQFVEAFNLVLNAYENILSIKPQGNSFIDYYRYYNDLANTNQYYLNELENANFSFKSVQDFMNSIINSFKNQQTAYNFLTNAFNEIMNVASQTTDPHEIAIAFKNASNMLLHANVSDQNLKNVLDSLAEQFNISYYYYYYLSQAELYGTYAKGSRDITTQIYYLEKEEQALQTARQFLIQLGGSPAQIDSVIKNVQTSINILQNIENYSPQLKTAIAEGNYLQALVLYGQMLKNQGVNIQNVINAVAENNYGYALDEVLNNSELQQTQKQFLAQLVSVLAVNYYSQLTQYELSQAHLTAKNWMSAIEQTFNYYQQVQPILNHLENAINYTKTALQFAQYISQSTEENIYSLYNYLQSQYNALYEQAQKAKENPVLNVLEGFANVFNTGLNNMLNYVNSFIYQRLGKNTFTEILSGIVDGAIFVLISMIPIVGEAFDVLATSSFLLQTGFDLLAGSASFKETVNGLKSMISNPQNLAMISTIVVSALAKHFVDIENVTADNLKLQDVKASINDAVKDIDISKIRYDIKTLSSFKDVTNLVREVKPEELDKINSKLVNLEAESINLTKTEQIEGGVIQQNISVLKNAVLKAVDVNSDIKNIDIRANADLDALVKGEENIELKISPKLKEGVLPRFNEESGKIELNVVNQEEALKSLKLGNINELLNNIKNNVELQLLTDIIQKLSSENKNAISISPDEEIVFDNGKYYDVTLKDGKPVSFKEIDQTTASAKIASLVDKIYDKFFSENSELINNLMKRMNNINEISYELSNDLKKNADSLIIRNENLTLKNELGQVSLKSSTELSKNLSQIKTVNELKSSSVVPLNVLPNKEALLTPEDIDTLLSSENEFSKIFKPLIDDHPEVKTILENLAKKGELTNNLTDLEQIANNIKTFYDSLSKEIDNIKSTIERNDLFNGVNVDNVIRKMISDYIRSHPDAVVKGEVPNISVFDVLRELPNVDKARIVMNYLEKYKDVDVSRFNDIMNKLNSLPKDVRDYILSDALKEIITGNEADFNRVLSIIDQDIDRFSGKTANISNMNNINVNEVTANVQQTTTEANINNMNNTTQQVLEQSASSKVSLTLKLEDILRSIDDKWDTYSEEEKSAILDYIDNILKEKKELSIDEIKQILDERAREIREVADEIDAVYKTSPIAFSLLRDIQNEVTPQKFVQILNFTENLTQKYGEVTAVSFLTILNTIPREKLNDVVFVKQNQIKNINDFISTVSDYIKLIQSGKQLSKFDLVKLKLLMSLFNTNNIETAYKTALAVEDALNQLKLNIKDIALLLLIPMENENLEIYPIVSQNVSKITPPTSFNVNVSPVTANVNLVNVPPVAISGLTTLQLLLNNNFPPPSPPQVNVPPQNNNNTQNNQLEETKNKNTTKAYSYRQILAL
ncbi:hypothetical protein [Saccharolobus islandicus]|uniref:hypothetical protein n=2 Tax=Saccharolobus islandicus TaxID=43080 RepID=UPI000366044B|nr:hypothetical protein [Sulfolobus islandicus]